MTNVRQNLKEIEKNKKEENITMKRFCQRDRKKYKEEELPCNRGIYGEECGLKKKCRYAMSKIGNR